MMAVQIHIRRNVTDSLAEDLTGLLQKMRGLCIVQPGYVSGQTLKRIDKPGEQLVISTWQTLEHWETWFHSNERQGVQAEIDMLLGDETIYEIYG
jgi:heme-degrading monooxygenase HmoA